MLTGADMAEFTADRSDRLTPHFCKNGFTSMLISTYFISKYSLDLLTINTVIKQRSQALK